MGGDWESCEHKSKLSEVFFELHGVYNQLQRYFYIFFLFSFSLFPHDGKYLVPSATCTCT